MYNLKALDVASFFIKKGVSPLKLQKLLYYAQLWFFVKNKEKLFDNEISAWIYGPVVYEVWNEFKFVKRNAIIPKFRASNPDLSLVNDYLDDIWSSYGHLSGAQLIDLTHNEKPWKNSRKGLLSHIPSRNEVVINTNTTTDFMLMPNNTIPRMANEHSLGNYSNY